MSLAKLVHFQGYPHSLLPVVTAGVPSMFICLDTAPELLSQPSIEKQVKSCIKMNFIVRCHIIVSALDWTRQNIPLCIL